MITLNYDIDANDWHRHLGFATKAIERWAEVQGKLNHDQFGYYYDVKVTANPKADVKPYWVLRPATLHLGATKVLGLTNELKYGWLDELADLWFDVSQGKQHFSTRSDLKMSTLDLIVQEAWFREVLFA